MSTLSFAAAVEDWVRKVKGAEEGIFRQATEEVIDVMQTPVGAGGHMPIQTGFLRASLMASTSAMPLMTRENPGAASGFDFAEVSLVIAGAELGQTIYAGYTANYAAFVNYGSQGRPARQFVELAAQRWPSIVDQVARQLKTRLGL